MAEACSAGVAWEVEVVEVVEGPVEEVAAVDDRQGPRAGQKGGAKTAAGEQVAGRWRWE